MIPKRPYVAVLLYSVIFPVHPNIASTWAVQEHSASAVIRSVAHEGSSEIPDIIVMGSKELSYPPPFDFNLAYSACSARLSIAGCVAPPVIGTCARGACHLFHCFSHCKIALLTRLLRTFCVRR